MSLSAISVWSLCLDEAPIQDEFWPVLCTRFASHNGDHYSEDHNVFWPRRDHAVNPTPTERADGQDHLEP